mgnify:CR=1 FL=1
MGGAGAVETHGGGTGQVSTGRCVFIVCVWGGGEVGGRVLQSPWNQDPEPGHVGCVWVWE